MDITELLHLVAGGDKQAEQDLLPRVYGELRRVAANQLRNERPNHTLQTTELVHEAYLRMQGNNDIHWTSRGQFYGMAAVLMRRILVDHARHRSTQKRGGGRDDLTLDEGLAVPDEQCALISALDESLQRLEQRNPRQAKVVELRFFGGLNEEEVADLLGIHVRTVRRDWKVARAWLYGEISV